MRVATESRPNVHGSARQTRVETGVGKAESDGPKSNTTIRFQKVTYCCQRRALKPIQLTQRFARLRDRGRIGLRETRRRRDRLFDRIDRRGVRDEEGEVDADKDDEDKLAEASEERSGEKCLISSLLLAPG